MNIAVTCAQRECNITQVSLPARQARLSVERLWFVACYLLFAARWSPSIRRERQSTSEFCLSPFTGSPNPRSPYRITLQPVRTIGLSQSQRALFFGPKQLRFLFSPVGLFSQPPPPTPSFKFFWILFFLFFIFWCVFVCVSGVGVSPFSFMGRDVAPAQEDALCHKGM